MPINFDRFNNQDITHWPVQEDNVGGLTPSAPIALKGRWEDRIENLITPEGESFVSKAKVWVSADVAAGDYLFEGKSVVVDPLNLEGAHRVQMFSKIPDIAGTTFERKATL
jgi:hypothetical protein